MATLKVNKGTTHIIRYQHQHDGVNQPLTGATLFFTAKSSEYDNDATDATAVISKTITSFTDAAGGYTEIELTPSDTGITPAQYIYDIKVKESDGRIYKMDEGKLKIDGSPTNRTA